MKKFLVVGSATIDIFVKGIHHFPTQSVDDFTNSSLTFTNQPTSIHLGGNGANTAYVLAQFGAPTYLCSGLGNDHLGHQMIDWLGEKLVDLAALHVSDSEATSVTTVLFDENNDRLSFHHLGSSAAVKFEHIPQEVFANTHTVLISGISLLKGLRPDGYLEILKQTKQTGARTALDFGPALECPPDVVELTPMLPYIDYLIANEFEVETATGENDSQKAAQILLEAGAKQVVIKQGGEGSIAVTSNKTFQVSAFEIGASVTVGAGDAFNAGFLHALVEGHSLENALVYGNATSALVLSTDDGILGAPTWQSVEDLVSTCK